VQTSEKGKAEPFL